MNTRKIGQNRGKARLWIEGNLLKEHWPKGTRFNIDFEADKIVYWITPYGKRKVAGTEDRPIIDTNTDKLLSIAAIGQKVQLEINAGFIIITKAEDNE